MKSFIRVTVAHISEKAKLQDKTTKTTTNGSKMLRKISLLLDLKLVFCTLTCRFVKGFFHSSTACSRDRAPVTGVFIIYIDYIP